MDTGVLLKKCLNCFSIDPALFVSSIVDIGDFVITQKCSEVLRVPDVLTFSQYCRLTFLISTLYLPFVSTGQSKEDMEWATILQHRLQFHPLDTPISIQ